MITKEPKISHTLMSEHDDHFLIHDGKGAIPIAKAALTDSAMKKIRKLSYFSQGGVVPDKGQMVDHVESDEILPPANDKQRMTVESNPKLEAASKVRHYADGDIVEPLASNVQDSPEQIQNELAATSNNQSVPPQVDTTSPSPADQEPVNAVPLPPGYSKSPEETKNLGEAFTQAKEALSGLGSALKSGAKGEELPSEGTMPKAPMQSAQKAPETGSSVPKIGEEPMQDFLHSKLSNLGVTGDALQAQQKAVEAGQAQQAEAFKQQQNKDFAAQKAFELEDAVHKDRSDKLLAEIGSGKIKPYWEGISTGNKIGAAIAIALGGLGGGLSGKGGNVALDVINKAIDRDLKEQEMTLNQKNKNYQLNREQRQDSKAAYAQKKLDALTMAQAKVNQAMAQTNSTVAQQQGIILKQGIEDQKAMLRYQLGTMNATNTAGPSADSIAMGIKTGIIPPAESKPALKEFGDYRKMQEEIQNAHEAFDTMVKTANYRGRILGGHGPTINEDSKQYEAAKGLFLDKFTKDLAGRVVPTSVDLLGQSMYKAGDSKETEAVKRAGVDRAIRMKYAFPTLETYHLYHQPTNSTNTAPVVTGFVPNKTNGGK